MPIPLVGLAIGAAIGIGLTLYHSRSTQEPAEFVYCERTEIEINISPEKDCDDDSPPRYTRYDTSTKARPQATPKQRRGLFRRGNSSSTKIRSNDDFHNTSSDSVGNSFSHNNIYNLDTGGGPVYVKADGNKTSLRSRLHFGKKERSSPGQGAGALLVGAAGAAGTAFGLP